MTELFKKVLSSDKRAMTLENIRRVINTTLTGGKSTAELYALLCLPPFTGLEHQIITRGSNSQFTAGIIDFIIRQPTRTQTDAILAHLQQLSSDEFYPGARQDLGLANQD